MTNQKTRSDAALERRLAERTRELADALERETASAEVLRVIANAPGDAEEVLDTIARAAHRLFGALIAAITRVDGHVFRQAASAGRVSEFVAAKLAEISIDRGSVMGRAAVDKCTVYVEDMSARAAEFPNRMVPDDGMMSRTIIATPLLRDGEVIGAISVTHEDVRHYTDKQIELLETFASQAVIAIENARLLNELRDSLERQTAAAEVLGVISASPGEVQPVFESMLDNAVRLCEASEGSVFTLSGDILRRVASRGLAAELAAHDEVPIAPDTPPGRMVSTLKTVPIPDLLAEIRALEDSPGMAAAKAAAERGARCALWVPMIKENSVIGAFILMRREARPFSETQIGLVENFANQAVIAIENARLLAELRESLESQTATSEVLRVVAESTTDIEPVMTVIAEHAARLCAADDVRLYRLSNGILRAAGALGFVGSLGPEEMPVDRGSLVGRTVIEKRLIHVDDVAAMQDEFVHTKPILARARIGSVLGVPMMREGRAVGVILALREEVAPFNQKQRDLIASFADQAAIAIENARLLAELNDRNRDLAESLERQTASADVLRAIADSPGEAGRVLDAIVTTTQRLFGSSVASVIRLEDGAFRQVAAAGQGSETIREQMSGIKADRTTVAGHAISDKKTVYVPNIQENLSEYTGAAGLKFAMNSRTVVATPLLREGEPIGAITVIHNEVHSYTDKQIELLETFADQAVIAIENTRLLDELNSRMQELSEALERQTASAEVLRVIAGSPGDADEVLQTIVSTAHRLFDCTFALIARIGDGVIQEAATAGPMADSMHRVFSGLRADASTATGRAVVEKRTIHVPDMLDTGVDEFPASRQLTLDARTRTILATPLLREGEALGVLTIALDVVRPFTDKQIELLETFADQAVIAIENARLLDELQTRMAELSDSLEREKASGEVLAAIADSPGNADGVLKTIVDTMHRLFGTSTAVVARVDGDRFGQATAAGDHAESDEYAISGLAIDGRTVASRAVLDRRTVRVDDMLEHADEFDIGASISPDRTIVASPLMREGEPIGVIIAVHREVSPYTDKQVELLETFADQAVIAIENARLLDELRESLESQTASAEILRAIASSPANADSALNTIAATTARLLGASGATIRIASDGKLGWAGSSGPAEQGLRATLGKEYPIDSGTLPGTVVLENRTVHLPDIDNLDPEIPDWPGLAPMREAGVRTGIGIPLTRQGRAIGALMVQRNELRPFTDKEIGQLHNFADQAVIAIENTRLLDELHVRNRDLSDALERQTASAEVLRAIAGSPGDADKVLETIVTTAQRLFGCAVAFVAQMENGVFGRAATAGTKADAVTSALKGLKADRSTATGTSIVERRTVYIQDIQAQADAFSGSQSVSRDTESRTVLATPLLREGEPLGALTVAFSEARPLTPKQIELLESFADQAVIAIENARLLDELHARNRDLSDGLEREKASAEVLRAIAGSPGDANEVLQTIVSTAHRLFGCQAFIARIGDGVFQQVAASGPMAEDAMRRAFMGLKVDASTASGRAVVEKRTIHVPDMLDSVEEFPTARQLTLDVQTRTFLTTPLLREGEALGALTIALDVVRPFTDKQIELLETFADQAVIAIENARLLRELHESLERRTATAEVLAAISASPGDVQPVFETMLDNAVRLCEASDGSVWSVSGDVLHRIASRGLEADLTGHDEISAAPDTPVGRMLSTLKTVHIPDLQGEIPAQQDSPDWAAKGKDLVELGARSGLWVPMIKDAAVIGAFIIFRREARPFAETQIALVENFANQAVIAIENARLLSELRSARDTAEQALGELKAAQASLIQAEKMASLGQLTAGIAHEIKNPLNFVNNFADVSVELLDELKESAAPALAEIGDDKRAEIDELIEMLTGNLDKVAEHGRRADGIVKSMLAHSRGGSGERQSVNLNALVEESLNLAYHGARAQDQDFNITLEQDLDRSLAPIEVVPQDLTRVFLNLFGNGFYAANKRLRESGEPAFQPTLQVTTRDLGSEVAIRIRDNGVGIAPELRSKLFEPFFTTKPTGEGTGLGLSISFDIVTEEHGGTIDVESEQGSYTEFIITLPKRAGPNARAQH